ncbi:hypothetical protein VOLCADRAFT_89744 [Volvox carteri f. nagariensis]|uniref:diacylglycerol O-acyltransferase n=1 Tax=Volvox carteri f. nagariensis TaxID=3068 RepID=D8TSJ0_VOLCA|nr:uncharacterized protein VOLCADRAFT_89744 [Volvox carteri f. nagariensis]EFJ49380.1 hypothetical protein VOLCADRAFT_89744 [Volvox carteri f. nagariensis]|eukprot:XP_002949361.1 hypothetical protein VOLCADRAFT_89744 [Volvox carteri f. nagariensis]
MNRGTFFLQENSSRDFKSSGLDVIAGRLACGWFLLTAIGQAWLWPVILVVVCYARKLWLTTAFLGYMLYVSIGPGVKAGRTCTWPKPLRSWSLWRLMSSYFDAKLIKTVDLDPSGNYLFVVHPHGVIAISSWINFVTEATGFSEKFPGKSIPGIILFAALAAGRSRRGTSWGGIDLHAATLGSNFRVPLLREYVLLHGMVDASRDTLRAVLGGPPGRSALLVVGGAAEALLAAPGTYDLVLQARKGFVKVALQTGATLVPVIAYGETDTFHTHIPQPDSKSAAAIRFNDKAIRGLHPGPDVPPEVLRSRNELFNKLRNQKKNAKTGSLWDNFDVEWWGGLPKLVCLFCDEPLSAANPSFTNAHHIKQGACKAIKQRAASLSQQQQQSGTSSAAAGPSTADQQAGYVLGRCSAGTSLVWRPRIKRMFGFSMPLCWGTGVFGGWGMMPLQTQLVTVVGTPLRVGRTPTPTDDQVNQVHGAYTAALKKLWDDTSDKYGKGRGVTSPCKPEAQESRRHKLD